MVSKYMVSKYYMVSKHKHVNFFNYLNKKLFLKVKSKYFQFDIFIFLLFIWSDTVYYAVVYRQDLFTFILVFIFFFYL